MSFFERAKAAATDLAAKADQAMTQAGINTPGSATTAGGGASPDRALRDLGVIAWLDANGRPVNSADRDRIMATLRELEAAGRLGGLVVSPPPAAPPPPPGAAATWGSSTDAAPPPPSAPPPPPPSSTAAAEQAATAPLGPDHPEPPPSAPEPEHRDTPPPPPPPSWA